MSDWVLATQQSGFSRHFGAEALPVRIGGAADDDVRLEGVRGSVAIDRRDGAFVVLPAGNGTPVRVDGSPGDGPRPLEDGSLIAFDTARLSCTFDGGRLVLQIDVRTTAGDTAPPDFDQLARAEAAEVAIQPVAFRPQADAAAGQAPRMLTPATIAIGTAFVVLIVIGWFAFTSKSIGFQITPTADSIELPDTLIRFRLGDRFLVRSGRHRVTAELAGYYPLDTEIDVGALGSQNFAFDLVKLPGLISFATESGIEATVRVDGEDIGTTPIVDAEIVPGTHQVEFVAPRHLPEVVTLEVEGEHAKQSVVRELTPSWAPVQVASVPAGATVLVDGEPAGETPAELELTAGERTIELRLPGYNAWQDRVRVVADEPQTLPPVTLEMADGRVELASAPTDASVSVDGEYRGRTPITLRLRPGRDHSITLAKPGYETAVRELSVAADSGRSLSVELTAQYGQVDVDSIPAGAEILVDGRVVGRTPARLDLLAVDQTIEVRADGYAGETSDVTPRPGYPLSIGFELTALDETTGSGFAPVVRTALDQELRLVPAGSFTMGTSRREEGRRSNEVLQPVELTQAFYLGVREVTNAEFREFMPDHDSGSFGDEDLNGDDQPVVRVTWDEAARFMNWLSVRDGLQPVYIEAATGIQLYRPLRNGYRLPTEAEWAWAARAAGRDAIQTYGWGDEPRPPEDRVANLADLSAKEILPTTLITYTDGFPVSAPVGSFLPNPVGIDDLDGNVAEWNQDYYEIVALPSSDALIDPLGPETGRFHVVRGPSWRSATVTDLRLAYRDSSADAREDLGFRIARSLPAAP